MSTEFENQLIKETDQIIQQLGAKDVYEGLRMVKENEDFIQQAETKLLNQYGVNTIDKVLIKQKQIIEKKRTRPEELAEKYPTEVLELALEMKETNREVNHSPLNSE